MEKDEGKSKERGQMSESFLTAVFIAMSGGLQDAYTYICRDRVFANAQTGNIVLFSANLFEGNFAECLRYLVPLLAFMFGIYCSETIRIRRKNRQDIHWRQLILSTEIFYLFIVGFLPQSLNLLANALVSFVCAMQVQAFRKVEGHAYASTMCIGNLRSGTDALCTYIHTHDKKYSKSARIYFGVIGVFALGAGLGAVLTKCFAEKSIWASCVFLLVSFILMFRRTEKQSKNA